MPSYTIPQLSLANTLKQHLEAFEKSVTIFNDTNPDHEHVKAHLFLETLPPGIRAEVTSRLGPFWLLLPLKFTDVRAAFVAVSESMDGGGGGERKPYHDLVQVWNRADTGDDTGDDTAALGDEGATQANNAVDGGTQHTPDTPAPSAVIVAPRAPTPAPDAPSFFQAALDKARAILPPGDQLAFEVAMINAAKALNALADDWINVTTGESIPTSDAVVGAMTARLSDTLDTLHQLGDEISSAQSSLDFGTSESGSTGASDLAEPTETSASRSDKSKSAVSTEDAVTISTETGTLSSDSTEAELMPHWGPFKYLGTTAVSPSKNRERLIFIIDRRGSQHVIQSTALLHGGAPCRFAFPFKSQALGIQTVYLDTKGHIMMSKPPRNNGKPPSSPDGLIDLDNVFACPQSPGFNVLSKNKLVQTG
ncbi:uncharacterized protein LOC62_06G008016 [Vanrija pseudolonga]|uniref:Uncharacterized protein n=1 Tax=Vanrija pseudolonga TaxID=143232 RepID=A0AAF0YEQ2_9TREE|nr:hypothetical protein LOC62_06G008016 [Vanrija pseudolonga]